MKVEVKQCDKYYGDVHALDDVSFTLEHGIYALLGPNGSGKSTLMNILCTVVLPNSGSVKWNGQDIQTCKQAYLDHVGYMPQYPSLYEDFSLFDYLSYIGVLKNMKREDIRLRIHELSKKVELEDVLSKKLKTYSGGMKQRAMLCVALMNDPDILILDEPTAGLDPLQRMLVQKLLTELSKDKIVLLATHVVSDVEFIADRFLILKKGKLIENCSRLELIQRLEHGVVEVMTTMEEYRLLGKTHKISAIRYEGQQLIARVIDPDNTLQGQEVACNVSDVYLHLFGENHVVL